MTRALITGFEPFGEWQVNSSWEGVRIVATERRYLDAALLPVDHSQAALRVAALIRDTRPDVVLLTGLAKGAAMRLEGLARPGPLSPHGGPVVRRGRWPFRSALSALAAQGIPARLSRNAGAYVCDTTYWAALGVPGPRLCLFLHVPPLGPGWSARRISRGIGAVLDAAL